MDYDSFDCMKGNEVQPSIIPHKVQSIVTKLVPPRTALLRTLFGPSFSLLAQPVSFSNEAGVYLDDYFAFWDPRRLTGWKPIKEKWEMSKEQLVNVQKIRTEYLRKPKTIEEEDWGVGRSIFTNCFDERRLTTMLQTSLLQ